MHTLNHMKAILLRIPAPRTLVFSPPYFPWLDLKQTEFAGSVYLLKKKVLKKKKIRIPLKFIPSRFQSEKYIENFMEKWVKEWRTALQDVTTITLHTGVHDPYLHWVTFPTWTRGSDVVHNFVFSGQEGSSHSCRGEKKISFQSIYFRRAKCKANDSTRNTSYHYNKPALVSK